MLRKLVTLLVLVGLVYMGYRIIDPIGAQALVSRVQSWFVSDEPAPVVVEQKPASSIVVGIGSQTDSGSIDTGKVVTSVVTTGVIIPTTSPVQNTGSTTPHTTTASKPPQTSHQPSSLSDQDMKDLQHLLNAIVE